MWDRKSLASVAQLSRSDIEEILSVASSFAREPRESCKGGILANIFFEPSTRTEKSFQAAMYRLGGQVITHKDAGSSREKGETKEDTIRILAGYADIAVIRDNEEGKMQAYSKIAGVPVINAGDGSNEHPTQTLLDMFTIMEQTGRLDGLKVAFVGDMKYSRTIHSLMRSLSKFDGNELYSVHAEGLSAPEKMKSMFKGSYPVSRMKEVLKGISPDVVYCNRVQKERLKGEGAECYTIDRDVMAVLPERCMIMDPLPRVGNISAEIDGDKRAAYFRQARNGVPVRMAVISMML